MLGMGAARETKTTHGKIGLDANTTVYKHKISSAVTIFHFCNLLSLPYISPIIFQIMDFFIILKAIATVSSTN